MNKLYIRLASTNIKNNHRLYLPYLLTGMLSAAMYYIMVAIRYDEGVSQLRGGSSLHAILELGIYVIQIFVFIFLFYTNSFIIKRRKRELGIYNILGMEKKHIARELALETIFSGVVSAGGGLAAGIVFHKLMMMLLYRMSGLVTPIRFYVSDRGIFMTLRLFCVIYAATLAYDLLQVRLANPITLLHGGNVGEREPKTKSLMAALGLACIAGGYYIAIVTENPLQALTLFFVAVVLVIVGTYFLFTAGSIAFLKLLRRNKRYYYQTRHFTAVSGMIYRMKQNAVGLANICILSTMVLVLVSTTVCLYAGTEDELKTRYPEEIVISGEPIPYADHGNMVEQLKGTIAQSGRSVTAERAATTFSMVVMNEGDEGLRFTADDMELNASYDKLVLLTFISRADYEAFEQTTLEELAPGEVMMIGNPLYTRSELSLPNKTWRVRDAVLSEENMVDGEYSMLTGGHGYYVVMADEAAFVEAYELQKACFGEEAARCTYDLYLGIDGSTEERIACDNAVSDTLAALSPYPELTGCSSVQGRYREHNRASYRLQNGGFLFLGIFLGSMFLMVTVLIIFYKQISEGYDDRERFVIMEKVGMSNREVKATINEQVRMVFFLPIVTAAIHVWAAFPMIRRLLMMFGLMNGRLFALCMVGTIAVFCAIYFVVFMVTSRSYYKIVGNQI
ncbi:MAG: ABC transporter permease [Roseburia sp.]|nr:ABC transporter permease [Roseburia sp.]